MSASVHCSGTCNPEAQLEAHARNTLLGIVMCTSKSAYPPTGRISSPRALTSLASACRLDVCNLEAHPKGVRTRQKPYVRPWKGAALAPEVLHTRPRRGTLKVSIARISLASELLDCAFTGDVHALEDGMRSIGGCTLFNVRFLVPRGMFVGTHL